MTRLKLLTSGDKCKGTEIANGTCWTSNYKIRQTTTEAEHCLTRHLQPHYPPYFRSTACVDGGTMQPSRCIIRWELSYNHSIAGLLPKLSVATAKKTTTKDRSCRDSLMLWRPCEQQVTYLPAASCILKVLIGTSERESVTGERFVKKPDRFARNGVAPVISR